METIPKNLSWDETAKNDDFFLPEFYLLCAVIKGALLDVTSPDKRIRSDALAWFFSSSVAPFSFIWCLAMLDLTDYYALIIEHVKSGKKIDFSKAKNRI